MKPTTKSTLRRVLPWCALTLLSAGSASAQTLLLSDNFDTAGDCGNALDFNDSASLTADQSGTAATKDYNITLSNRGSDCAYQRGNGGKWLMYANGAGRWRNKHAGQLEL